MVVQNQSQLGEGSAILTDPHHTPTFIQPSTQPQKIQQPRKTKRKDTQVPQLSDPIKNVTDEAVYKELGDSLVRAATTASSLEAKHDNGNINKTQSKAITNESSSLETTSGGGPWCQETIGDTIAQTRLKLDELMALCTTLQNSVLDLEKTKTTQHNEIASLKRRVKKLEKKNRSRTYKLKRLYKVDADEKLAWKFQDDADKEMFDVDALNGEEVFVAGQNENVVEEDKGKGIMIKEPVKPMKKKDQISFDKEVPLKLQAEFVEEKRLAREKAEKEKEANNALIETCDDIQEKIDVDYQLAERLQAQEQEELSIKETTSGGGPWCQETIGDTIAQTRFENVSKHSNDSLLARGNILQSNGDRLKLDELMALCTTLQNRVLDLEKTKTTQHNEIASLKRRVKKLEKKISAVGNVVSTAGDAPTVSAATTTTATITTDDDITLAQALMEIKSTKPKEKGVVIQELGESTTIISSQLSSQQSQDKGKGILIEPVKPMKKKDLIRLDEEAALKLQAEFDEEERLAREKAKKEKEANIALIETWDDIQAKIDADHQLAERLQAQEQEELSIEEKATLFQQLLEKRRKHFAAKRAKEKRNKPPIKAQQRKIMCTYLKNMKGYKLKDLKLKEFDSIQEMFDRAFKRVNTFEDFRTELVKGKEKRAGTELIQENAKKQKVEDDKEIAELKHYLEIIPDEEEVKIDAIPLVVKSPSIVGLKIYKEGRKSYYQIMRANGKSQTYMIFSQMLKSFDRQDLEDFYKLVKAKYESTRPVEDLDLLLWGDLKTMFEPHVEDNVWRNQQEYKVLDWKLYDFCGVHSLRMQHMQIYMLVEKKYPLAPLTLSMMLEKKLIIDFESEMAYQLLKFIIKQLKSENMLKVTTASEYQVNAAKPKNVNEALGDESWIFAMQEELNQFVANDVWDLVPQPRNMTIIGTKWVFRNKLDENGIVSRNKARLVAQGYYQQEGIDYDGTYALVDRLESIRILLAYSCALDIKLF
ncbi:uncharacterized mitochondrial protein-like protein [Tanacetum coccineum]